MKRDPDRSPRAETLADFAAGRLDEARAAVIAAYAARNPDCAREINMLEAAAGALLETAEPVAMSADALENVLAKAGDAVSAPYREQSEKRDVVLGNYIDLTLDEVDWQWVAPGVRQHVFDAQGYRKGALRLVEFAPGKGVPMHSHEGEELTLLLRGAYCDNMGEWRAGDIADLNGGHKHEPIAIGDEPCVCLIATSAPLEFKTMLGKVLQPFVRL